jgi:hypothetical protein
MSGLSRGQGGHAIMGYRVRHTGKRRRLLRPLFLGLALVAACAGVAQAQSEAITLAWDAPAQFHGGAPILAPLTYRVHIGTMPREYTRVLDAGTSTSLRITGLSAEQRYFIAVTARSGNGIESPFSAELLWPSTNVPLGSLKEEDWIEPGYAPNRDTNSGGVRRDRAAVPMDYDGDAAADVAVYHADGGWYVRRSVDGALLNGAVTHWGWSATRPVTGDFDGDGLNDIACYGPGGAWYVRRSSDGALDAATWGWDAAKPVPQDYDGDGRCDRAVWDPATSTWYVQCTAAEPVILGWGWSATTPVPADYDGDGAADLAVYHAAGGAWYVRESRTGNLALTQWGWSEALPVQADYDGDGRCDVAVYHPASGTWYIRPSASPASVRQQQWGWLEATPAPADYDGDGRGDVAVYHQAAGMWFIQRSAGLSLEQAQWGWHDATALLHAVR